jgi:uncharacterized membrane protein
LAARQKGAVDVNTPKNRVDLKIYNFILGFQIFYLLMLITNPRLTKLTIICEEIPLAKYPLTHLWIYLVHSLEKIHYSVFSFLFLIVVITLVYLFYRYGESVKYSAAISIVNLLFLIFNSLLSYSILVSIFISMSGKLE